MQSLVIDTDAARVTPISARGAATKIMQDKSAADILEDLYDLHGEAVFSWIRGMLGSREAAEDGVQSVWLNLARKPSRLSRIVNSRAYVWSAARNHVNSVLRRRALERLWMQPLVFDDADVIATHRGAVSISDDERRDLMRSVQKLSPKLRAVVVLVSFLGFTLEEAAERLGLPRGTAASRYHAALQNLKLSFANGD